MAFGDMTLGPSRASGVVLSVAMMSSPGCAECADHSAATRADDASVATATIEGVVRIKEGVALPAFPPPTHQNQPEPPKSCSPPKLADRQPVALGQDGVLSQITVGVTGFRQMPPSKPKVHDVAIRDCRLVPSVVTATKGDTLRLRNETDYPFLPEFGGKGLLQALLKGEARDMVLDRPGVQKLGCGFAAPCGRLDLMVFHHPLHAITGKNGQFRVVGVPLGAPVLVHAWHPLFDAARVSVTPEAGRTHRVEIELVPNAAVAEAARVEGGAEGSTLDSRASAAAAPVVR